VKGARSRAHLLAAAVEHAALPARLVFAVREALRPPVLDESPLADPKPLATIARNGLTAFVALALKPLLRLPQPRAPALRPRHVVGQLVAATRAVDVVLSGIEPASLLDNLRGDLIVAADRPVRRRGGDLAPIERDHPNGHKPGVGAETEHLAEQIRESRFMPDAEARDRGMVRNRVGRDHAERDVLPAALLDRARGTLADRVGVDQKRNHHRRVVRRGAPTVLAVRRVEGSEIELGNRVEHEPSQMVLGQPLSQARR
jgi:hypothetical protein